MLGADAQEGEANVVELEVLGYNDKKHKIPICVTKAGPNHVTNVDVSWNFFFIQDLKVGQFCY